MLLEFGLLLILFYSSPNEDSTEKDVYTDSFAGYFLSVLSVVNKKECKSLF
jgi:hypothetical protein